MSFWTEDLTPTEWRKEPVETNVTIKPDTVRFFDGLHVNTVEYSTSYAVDGDRLGFVLKSGQRMILSKNYIVYYTESPVVKD